MSGAAPADARAIPAVTTSTPATLIVGRIDERGLADVAQPAKSTSDDERKEWPLDRAQRLVTQTTAHSFMHKSYPTAEDGRSNGQT